MSTETTEAPRGVDATSGVLCFLGSAVFPVWVWSEGDLHYMQPEGLDLVAACYDEDDLPGKLGSMVFDLVEFLEEEVDDRTEAEEDTAQYILERLLPPLIRHVRAEQQADLLRRLRSAFATTVQWRVGPPSTPHGSVPALSG